MMWSLYILIIASLVSSASGGSADAVADGTVADGTSGTSSSSSSSSSSTVVTTSTGVTSTSTTTTTTTGASSGTSSGAAASGSASSGTSGSATLVDYDPCAGRACGDVCNNCQLGELCPSVVNRCDPNGACVATTFECLAPSVDDTSNTAAAGASADSTSSGAGSGAAASNNPAPVATRHPLVRVQCGMQSQASCYGLSADLTAEYDGVCGWSAQQRRCVVVSIGEEGKEGAMCQMHRTIAACNGGSLMGFGQQMVPPMMGGEGIDNVCAWNPFTNSCKDGQLENEAGDGAGFGIASFSVCNGVQAANCPAPFCFWTGSGCVPSPNMPNLKKEHPQQEQKPSETEDPWYLLGAVAGSAFILGLGVTFVATRLFASKSSFQEPLHLETV